MDSLEQLAAYFYIQQSIQTGCAAIAAAIDIASDHEGDRSFSEAMDQWLKYIRDSMNTF